MKDLHITPANPGRRRLLTTAVAVAAVGLNPAIGPDKKLQLFKEARAWYLQAISLAVTAVSMFSKSDNGMGAMLQGIMEMTQESIRLSQQILIEIGKLQASIELLPERIHEVLIEHSQYQVRHDTSAMQSNMAFVESRMRNDKGALKSQDVIDRLNNTINIGSALAGAKDVPYGVGPVGAMCVAVAGACMVKAYTLLGQRAGAHSAMEAKILPWMDQILDANNQYSLASLFIAESKALDVAEKSLADQVPTRLRGRLTDKDLLDIAKLPSGQTWGPKAVACVAYNRQVATQRVIVGREPCFPRLVAFVVPNADGKTVEYRGPAQGSGSHDPECNVYEDRPVFSPESARDIALSIANTTTLDVGPAIEVKTELLKRGVNPSTCETVGNGTVQGDAQLRVIDNSDATKSWLTDIDVLSSKSFKDIISRREIVWSYFNLLQSVREARARAKGVFQL